MKKLILISALLLVASNGWADVMKMDQAKYTALKSFADKRLRETKIPGAGLGIIKDGKVIFAGGFGARDLSTGEAVNSQTAYLIGSSTKSFTSTTMAMLPRYKHSVHFHRHR